MLLTLLLADAAAVDDLRAPPLFLNEGFAEIPDQLICDVHWVDITAKPIFISEPIHILEARALLLRAEQLASHPVNHHAKHPI